VNSNAAVFERHFTTVELAAITCESPRTYEKRRLRGIGPRFIRVGKLVRYPESAVREYLGALPGGGSGTLSAVGRG